MDFTRVLAQGPCPFGLSVLLTVAHVRILSVSGYFMGVPVSFCGLFHAPDILYMAYTVVSEASATVVLQRCQVSGGGDSKPSVNQEQG